MPDLAGVSTTGIAAGVISRQAGGARYRRNNVQTDRVGFGAVWRTDVYVAGIQARVCGGRKRKLRIITKPEGDRIYDLGYDTGGQTRDKTGDRIALRIAGDKGKCNTHAELCAVIHLQCHEAICEIAAGG